MSLSVTHEETLNELETVKQQMAMYKEINAGLSQKIQELKLECSLHRQENAQLRRELLEERTEKVKHKSNFKTIHDHFNLFFKTYVEKIQEICENDSTLIDQAPETPKNRQISEAQQPLRRTRSTGAICNMQSDQRNCESERFLNTITEESSNLFTSTPNPSTGRKPFMMRNSPIMMPEPSTNMATPSNNVIIDTPRAPTVPAVRRISSHDTDEIIDSNKENSLLTTSENKSSEDEDTSILQHTTVKHIKKGLRSLRVEISPLKRSHSEHDIDECCETENSMDKMQERSNRSSSVPNTSVNLPRRKARPSKESLIEPSLRTKMRRENPNNK